MAPLRRLVSSILLVGVAAALGAAAVAPPGNAIRVRSQSRDTVVTLLPSPSGGLIRADVIARLLDGTLEALPDARWRLTLATATVELESGLPFVSHNGFALPLIDAPLVVDGNPMVPLQLFSEIYPRFGVGILWDRERAELRLLRALSRRVPPAASVQPPTAPTSAPPTASPSATRASAPNTSPAAPSPAPSVSTPSAPKGNGDATQPRLSRRYTVVIDAGHGGRDPGMRGAPVDGRPVLEKHVTLAVSEMVEELLRQRGIDVVMTRRADTLIGLYDRGPIANRRKGDLFISVHVNAANPGWKNASAARGFETYFLSEARTEDERRVARMENEVVRFETGADAPKGDPLSFIINDMAQNEHLRESADLAETMQRMLRRSHPGPNRGVKQAGLAVLSTAFMPAVLVEIGFASNPAEARWLASEAGQRQSAEAIADAAIEYLTHYERRAGSAGK